MRKSWIGIFAVLMFLVIGCEQNADEADRVKVEAQQSQYAKAQPIPQFDFSLERGVVIQLYSARNKKVATHTVWRSNTGMVEGDCPSIGYPIPYDTSLTNPLKRDFHSTRGSVVLEQPEPNGVFASKNSIATWVRCIVSQGETFEEVPIYIESKVTTYPFPVIVNYDKNRVKQKSGSKATLILRSGK